MSNRSLEDVMACPCPTDIRAHHDLLDFACWIARWPMPYGAASRQLTNASEAWREECERLTQERDAATQRADDAEAGLEWLRANGAEVTNRYALGYQDGTLWLDVASINDLQDKAEFAHGIASACGRPGLERLGDAPK